MSSAYKFCDQNELYFTTTTVVGWMDAFSRNEYRDMIVKSIKYCQANKGLEVYGWTLMPNHLHMIIGSHQNKMEDIMRDMKSYTSGEMRKLIHENTRESRKHWMLNMFSTYNPDNPKKDDWHFWQGGNHPVKILDAKMFYEKLDYIDMNPVVAGYVDRPEAWLYGSASYYGDPKKTGMIELSYIK